jgi:hypothetical protein
MFKVLEHIHSHLMIFMPLPVSLAHSKYCASYFPTPTNKRQVLPILSVPIVGHCRLAFGVDVCLLDMVVGTLAASAHVCQ